MAGVNENYNEYVELRNESVREDIDRAVIRASLDNLESSILSKKHDFKTPDSINHLYRLEWWRPVFQLDNVKNYLDDVYKRLSWMKTQNFWEISKENNFTWIILAIQIALKAMGSNPKNPKKYVIGKINGEYNEDTKNAIKQFQTVCKLTWKDWKPWKETIWRIVKELGILINNRRLEKTEQEVLKTDVTNIIEEAISLDASPWIYTKDLKEIMVNYIINWGLNAAGRGMVERNNMIEFQLNNLSKNPDGWKLKYLLEHVSEPLKVSIKKIKEMEWNLIEKGIVANRTFNKYTSWENLTQWQKDAMADKLRQLGSPITVEMVQDSCKKTNVPVEYLLAFMQNDSRLWTDWNRAIRNHNPWNVWNTDNGRNKYYATWADWVMGCAEHLQDRISAYWNKFKKFPTVIELAKWVWYKWVYMTAKDWPKNVNINLNNWVVRLKWK